MDIGTDAVDRLHGLAHRYQPEVNVTLCLRTLISLIDSVTSWRRTDVRDAVVDAIEEQLAGYDGIMQEMQGQ